ncbi:cutinase-domain-containing protein [Ustulina deusta]|nr:cutinase-domain-containing protein [Ustulina deusta]KAI3330549.1 cutinase-domain-containing protein [Ustulina deusta]
MKATLLAPIIAAAGVRASPAEIAERQSCPDIYVFGARETTASPGYGTAGGLVNMVLAAYSGSQSAAINYPACGGQASCGGVSYDQSATQGTAAVVSAVTSLNSQCPSTRIVLIGYSQGGQIMDNALCGGAGATLTGNALAAVKAAIFMGDPHNIAGLSYNVGTCTAGGFAARPSGFQCSPASPSLIKSYCDSTDPYCCNGNDANSHQQYVVKYGSQALAFIESLLDGSGGTTPDPGTGGGTGDCSVAKWGQCGGQGYTGCATCASGATCQAQSQYYSQCL